MLEKSHLIWCRAAEDFIRKMFNDTDKAEKYKFTIGHDPKTIEQARTKQIDAGTLTIRAGWNKMMLEGHAKCKTILQTCKNLPRRGAAEVS